MNRAASLLVLTFLLACNRHADDQKTIRASGTAPAPVPAKPTPAAPEPPGAHLTVQIAAAGYPTATPVEGDAIALLSDQGITLAISPKGHVACPPEKPAKTDFNEHDFLFIVGIATSGAPPAPGAKASAKIQYRTRSTGGGILEGPTVKFISVDAQRIKGHLETGPSSPDVIASGDFVARVCPKMPPANPDGGAR
jgi:hypothetical protein